MKALFKDWALPLVIEEIAGLLHLAASNSAESLRLLHSFASTDPSGVDILDLAKSLASSSFGLRQDSFPPLDLVIPLKKLGIEYSRTEKDVSDDRALWLIYIYLCALLPYVVPLPWIRYRKRFRGGLRFERRRWSASEYDRLVKACFEPCLAAADTQRRDFALHCYSLLYASSKSWFSKRQQMEKALDETHIAKQVVECFSPLGGELRKAGFAEAVVAFMEYLEGAFRGTLRVTYMYAGTWCFFTGQVVSLPELLPAHIRAKIQGKF